MTETFGARLKRLRREHGLQQSDLTGTGVSVSYISMLENDNREPTERVVAHLARALGVDPRDLTGPTPQDELSERQRLELAGAEMLLVHGDWATAQNEFRRLEPSLGLPASWGLARSLEALGWIEEALIVIDRVIATADDDPVLAVRALIARARCLAERGEETQSLVAARGAVELARGAGLDGTDEHVQASSTLVGQLYAVGLYSEAELVATELLTMVDAGGSWKARGSAYWNAAGVAEARGDLDQAVAHAQRALAVLSEGDDERAWARCAVATAWFWMRHDNAKSRLTEIQSVLSLAATKLTLCGTELDLAYLETEQARADLLMDNPREAAIKASSALGRLGDDQRGERATTLLVLAEARLALQEKSATEAAEQLELTLMALPRTRGTALTWRGLADVWKRLGHADAAYRALEEALNSQAITASPNAGASKPTRSTKRAKASAGMDNDRS